jgi:hypothetical protein
VADQAKKDQSQAQQKNAQRAADGRKAMADYEAEAVAVRAKTERLKALRLAKEATEGPTTEADPQRPATPKKKSAKGAKGGKGAKGASSTLSDWLQSQEKGGRRT